MEYDALASIGHDHGPDGRWVNLGQVCFVCTKQHQSARRQRLANLSTWTRMYEAAKKIKEPFFVPDASYAAHQLTLANRILDDIRRGRQEDQRMLAEFDDALVARNQAIRDMVAERAAQFVGRNA